jgi:ketosteroid isomerase-like protein
MLAKTVGSVTFALLTAAVAWEVVAQGTSSQGQLQETLLAQETKLLNAIEAKDRPALDKLLADQVLGVTVDRGRRTTAAHIASLDSLSVKNYQISEPKAIRVSPDVAILSFKLSWTSTAGGKPTATTVYATVVWKQVDGQWRSVFYQETPIAK